MEQEDHLPVRQLSGMAGYVTILGDFVDAFQLYAFDFSLILLIEIVFCQTVYLSYQGLSICCPFLTREKELVKKVMTRRFLLILRTNNGRYGKQKEGGKQKP